MYIYPPENRDIQYDELVEDWGLSRQTFKTQSVKPEPETPQPQGQLQCQGDGFI